MPPDCFHELMTNKQIARVLRETGALIELTGGNAFRARAYQGASRIVERLDEPAADLARNGGLTNVSGIGPGVAAQVHELVERGSFALFDELVSAIPPGLLEILRIKGIGARKARTLWKQRGITTLEELEEAATIGRLADLPGFGVKSQETILQNVRLFKSYRSQRRYAEAVLLAEPFLDALRAVDGVQDVSPTGALRRCLEVVPSADYVVAATDVEAVSARLHTALALEASVGAEEGTVLTGALPDGLAVNVRVVPLEDYGSALWASTGSDAHCEAVVARFGMPSPSATERAVFESAGIPYIEPELRENLGEIEAATSGMLPRLITRSDLRGVLHNHSTYSDGAHTLRQMAESARAKGFAYFGICDHSRSLTIANGLTIERVEQQQEEIRALNASFAADGGPPFRVFSGIESDVLLDGSLDYPDDVLATFDFVVASVHSNFNMTEAEATERLIRAVNNPYTTILGHATGRLLLTRAGYPIDHEAVIAACAAAGVAIELNANPRRLDMDWRWLRSATAQGVLISINPDAHSIDELDYVRWGVAAARKGWLTAEQCLNARSVDQLESWFASRRAERRTAVS